MKNYPLIISSFFFAEFGRAMYFVTITWLLYKQTGNAAYTGLLISLGFVPGMLANLYIGVIVDRLSKKTLCLIGLGSNAFIIAFLLFMLILNPIIPWIIFIGHMVQQLMGTLFKASAQAYTAEAFSAEDLPKVFSHSNASAIIGSLLGAGLGGILLGFFAGSLNVLLVMIAYLIGYYCIFKLDYKKQNRTKQGLKVKQQLVDGFTYLTKHTYLFRLFGIMFVGQLTFHSTIGFLSIYTLDHLQQSTIVYGLLDAFFSVGGVIAGLLGTWWWYVRKSHLASNALIIILIGLLTLHFTASVTSAFVGVTLIGIGTTWIRVLLQSAQQILTTKAYHGRMSSYRMLFNHSSIVISGPILGWVATKYGVTTTYLLLTLPVLFALILALQQKTLLLLTKVTS